MNLHRSSVHKSIIKGHKRIGTIPGMIGTFIRIGWNETPDSLAKVAGISNWEVPKFEVGYWCRSSCQRRGYVTEAVKGLTRIGFEQLGANRIEIRCDSRNVRSYRIAERTGYKLEAELKYEQRAPDGILRTTLVYALFSDEYRNSPVYFGNS